MIHFHYSINIMKKKDILKKFGRKVRELRQMKKISQEELAFKAEMHRTYIGGIERGERNVSLINIIKIETESGKGSQIETSWGWVIGVVIVIIILIILAVFFVLKKRKKRLIADVEYIPSRDAKDMLAAGATAKPGTIAAPTVIIDQVPAPEQKTELQPATTSAEVPGL